MTLWLSSLRVLLFASLLFSTHLVFWAARSKQERVLSTTSIPTTRIFPTSPFNSSNAFITSAYYYRSSKSLGENALALVVVLHRDALKALEQYPLTIQGSRGNTTEKSLATFQVEAPQNTACEYVMALIQSSTITYPETLSFESNGLVAPIPFKTPRAWAPSPVIICISPQFVAEKWQLFLMNIHVVRRYGGHMHLYITSIVEELFNVLQVYEQWGSLSLDYWNRIKFSSALPSFSNPMASVEWRNQAGAQTDCLLQYKEVAEYIAFFDIDEVLIPHLSQNYHQEFSTHFDAYPSYHSIFFMKRNVEIEKVLSVSEFSFKKLFSTMKVQNVTEYGKVVVDPLKYNSTWIHHSLRVPGNTMYNVLGTQLLHVKELFNETDNDTRKRFPVKRSDLKFMDDDFKVAFNRIQNISLIDHDFYAPIVFQCYNQSFYHSWYHDKKGFEELCPNADKCDLPQRDDIKCIHSDASYKSGPPMHPITFHYAVDPFWSRDIGCYQ